MSRVQAVRRRNAGPSSSLSTQHRQRRMQLCEEMVSAITFGDLKDFIKYTMEKYPDVVDEA